MIINEFHYFRAENAQTVTKTTIMSSHFSKKSWKSQNRMNSYHSRASAPLNLLKHSKNAQTLVIFGVPEPPFRKTY